MEARSAITIRSDADTVYRRWRALERLPDFMYHLESVTEIEPNRYHWVAKSIGGRTLEWDAVVVDDVAGQRISWQSVEGSKVDNAGVVRFVPAPGGRGTEVHAEVSYAPPGGAIGAAVAKLVGENPAQQVSDDLRRFKQIVETGEVARSDGSAAGERNRNQTSQRPAQPMARDELIDLTEHEVAR
jgi:uncharacterized membrane protein